MTKSHAFQLLGKGEEVGGTLLSTEACTNQREYFTSLVLSSFGSLTARVSAINKEIPPLVNLEKSVYELSLARNGPE